MKNFFLKSVRLQSPFGISARNMNSEYSIAQGVPPGSGIQRLGVLIAESATPSIGVSFPARVRFTLSQSYDK